MFSTLNLIRKMSEGSKVIATATVKAMKGKRLQASRAALTLVKQRRKLNFYLS